MENNEDIIENIQDEVIAESEPDRPRESPAKNFLYTVICILIYAVGYVGVKTFKFFYNSEYMYMLRELDDTQLSIVSELAEVSLSEENIFCGGTIVYTQSSGITKLVFELPSSDEDEAMRAAEGILGFEFGDISEEIRVSVTDFDSHRENYYYANIYTDIDNPDHYAAVYENDGKYNILLVTNENISEFKAIFKNGEKI